MTTKTPPPADAPGWHRPLAVTLWLLIGVVVAIPAYVVCQSTRRFIFKNAGTNGPATVTCLTEHSSGEISQVEKR